MQITSAIRRCRRPDRADPARPRRPSTFWVISRSSPGRAASARWPALGSARAHPPPAQVAARPVLAARPRSRHELLERHRHPGRRVRAAVVGHAGVRREPRTREYDERSVTDQPERGLPRSVGSRPGSHSDPRVSGLGTGPGLGRLFGPVLRRRVGDQVVEQVSRDVGDVAPRPCRRRPGWPATACSSRSPCGRTAARRPRPRRWTRAARSCSAVGCCGTWRQRYAVAPHPWSGIVVAESEPQERNLVAGDQHTFPLGSGTSRMSATSSYPLSQPRPSGC